MQTRWGPRARARGLLRSLLIPCVRLCSCVAEPSRSWSSRFGTSRGRSLACWRCDGGAAAAPTAAGASQRGRCGRARSLARRWPRTRTTWRRSTRARSSRPPLASRSGARSTYSTSLRSRSRSSCSTPRTSCTRAPPPRSAAQTCSRTCARCGVMPPPRDVIIDASNAPLSRIRRDGRRCGTTRSWWRSRTRARASSRAARGWTRCPRRPRSRHTATRR